MDDNRHRKVFLDAHSDGSRVKELQPTEHVLADADFVLEDQEEGLRSRVRIRVGDVARSQLSYAHGTWRLQGYFAVQGLVDVWMGESLRILVPITLKEAVA